jgi:hypothetical protein
MAISNPEKKFMTDSQTELPSIAPKVSQSKEAVERERFFYLVVMLLILIAAARVPLDSDLWWHLRSGEVTVKASAPLLTDPFSFTVHGNTWINHSWLSQVGMYILFHQAGYLGLAVAVAIIATLSMALVYAQMDGNGIFRGFTILFGLLVAAPVWSARPQILSLLFMAFTLWMLFRYKWKQKNDLWILPFLFILWSNLHGGYPLGLLVCGSVIAGEIGNHLLGYSGIEILSWRRIFWLVGISILCGLVVVINPNGLNMWSIPFQTIEVNILQKFIVEWASPDFHDLIQIPFLWLLMGTLAAIGLSGKRLDGTDLVAVILFGIMALLARRNFGPFALAATPVFSRHLYAAYTAWNERTGFAENLRATLEKYRDRNKVPSWIRKSINLGGVGFLLFCACCKIFVVSHPILIDQQLEQNQPTAAVAWMKSNAIQGNLLNEYGWGGYLDWFARGNRVFVDGRTDLFGDKILGDWIEIVQAGPKWKETLSRYPVDYVLLQPDRPLVNVLRQDGWNLYYQDRVCVLMGK